MGGALPLATNAMFHKMTFAGASSFLGAMGALLTIVPWILVFYGTEIRARSRFAKVGISILISSSAVASWGMEEAYEAIGNYGLNGE